MNNKQVLKLTENDLHQLVKKSVKKILKEFYDYGKWGSATASGQIDISEKFFDLLFIKYNPDPITDEEYEDFQDYCIKREDLFVIYGTFSGDYDETTGYGDRYSPIFTLEKIQGDKELLNYIENYPDEKVRNIAVKTLNEIFRNLDDYDFDMDYDY